MSNKEHKTSLSNESGSGFGEFDLPDGSKYEGEFKDEIPNGQGTFTWSDGQKYKGKFKDMH